ncbi:VWA domain-containing protein [Solibacillus merdavium]|uniref:VWA domain-containing protein n=1 Tax=Solibacillus merdavium TaxID=2762218 RepID=A0ABR8XJP1_9BACL|nr:VWA domain-containing protein [Solibacillus merdavium]MBD8032128.1 VWA domain-containing protein [Solibacillus merdavium]
MNKMKKLMAMLLSCLLVLSLAFPFGPIEVEAANKQISDITKSNSKYKAAKWAVDKDYMQLYGGNKFQSGTLVMEWQMLQFLAKLDSNYHFNTNNKDMLYEYYKDLNIPLYGADNPAKRNANISRGHFARLYAAVNGLDLSEVQAVQYLYMNEITTGTSGKRTFEDYKPTRNINRGDMAVFMYRINQQGKMAIEGLSSAPTGKDNNKITLPTNFVESKDGTVAIPTKPGKNPDDKTTRPDIYKAVKDIKVAKEELTANGLDSSLVTINLRDSYGNDISFDESLAFKVTSVAGAKVSETNASTSGQSTVVYTDGPQLNVYVTAPALTKSVVDTIRFEMVNPTEKYHTYKNQVIEVAMRYVPKAELRITYEVFDPEQTEWNGGTVDPGVRPLPALPQGVVETTTVPFTTNGIITISNYDEDMKVMTGSKWESYTTSDGKLTQGQVTSKDIQYGNADLKLEGQIISVWLFEQILDYMIEGPKDESSWGGLGSAKVMYTVNNEGRATYDLQGVMSEEDTVPFNSMLHAVIIYLTGKFLPIADQITLAHEESVEVIKAMYDRLGQIDKNLLRKDYADLIGKLEGAVSKIAVLQAGKELQQRPEGMDRYTKVIVNLVAPSGVIITDYKGTVEVTFNGKTRVVSFDTNTKDYNNNTGSRGSAVVYFDDILYGNSQVKARLIDLDPRYDKIFQGLKNTTVTQSVFSNPRFENNLCAIESEVMFVVDHSGSMKVRDAKNYTADKVKQTVKQIGAKPSHVYRFSNRSNHEATDTAAIVSSIDSLLSYKNENRSTNIVAALKTAVNNFTTNQYTNKAIVLVTDGYSNSNGLDEVIRMAKEKGIAIHTVSVGSYTTVNEKLLKDISSETKGTYQNISTIENLHGSLQSIITTILCKTPTMNNSCLVGDTIFNRTDVRIEERVTILADVNTGCENVKAVRVVFISPSGDVRYDLPERGSSRFMHRPQLYEFPEFDLYVEVEFQALDESGNVIATKIHNM